MNVSWQWSREKWKEDKEDITFLFKREGKEGREGGSGCRGVLYVVVGEVMSQCEQVCVCGKRGLGAGPIPAPHPASPLL